VTAAFDYSAAPFAIREDLAAAYARAWEGLARPGNWWTGAQRVALAAEVRAARSCRLCAERKAALSPMAVQGKHDGAGSLLVEPAVDAVHRIVTDATRLSRSFVEKLAADGLGDGHYVELLGVVVSMVSIDAFHRALGLEPEPLPAPEAGEPTRARPASAVPDVGWVPMIPEGKARGSEADLYSGRAPNVIRALSLVPDAVRRMRDLSGAQYVPLQQLTDLGADPGRALSRAQIELLAGRVSAVNECFY
jgi:hypothetical protein